MAQGTELSSAHVKLASGGVALPPFDPYAPEADDATEQFWNEARQVERWADSDHEEFMRSAHALRVAELQHGIHVAEAVARSHTIAAERALDLANGLREVAQNVAQVGQTTPARER